MEDKKVFKPKARGYELGEVVSALQKEIRRGNAREALYWAYAMLPQYEDYLWRRLLIICVEDVGMGDPDALVRLRACRDTWYEMRTWKGDSYHLAIAQAVQVLCRSPKTRTNDYLQCVVRAEFDEGRRREVPDYALDMHTARGREMGRGTQHFREEGAKLHPMAFAAESWEEEARSKWDAGLPKRDAWAWRRKGEAQPEAAQKEEPEAENGSAPAGQGSLFG